MQPLEQLEIECAHVERDDLGLQLHITATDGKNNSIARIWLEHKDWRVQEAGQKALHALTSAIGMVAINDSADIWFKTLSREDWRTVLALSEAHEERPRRRLVIHATPPVQTPSQEPKDGRFVYVISCHDVDEPLCKIGIANSPEKRLRQLSTSSPHALRLELTRYADNARAVEAAAHSHFSADRRNGEWFAVPTLSAITFVNSEVARRSAA